MQDDQQLRQERSVNPVMVGLAGMIVGAAGVAAIALSDKETRKKATKKANQLKTDLQKWSTEKIHEIRMNKHNAVDQINSTADSAEETIIDAKEELAEIEK